MDDDAHRLLGSIDANVKTLLKWGEDHEKRIRVVEKKVWFVSGAFGLVSLVVTWLTKIGWWGQH
jgi:hypothetical protein